MNWVVFMPDEMRAESVSCYGHPLVQMPHYDRVAREGVRFDQCHVQHPVCSPARCSLFTGWYPHTAGHRTLWHLLQPHEPNLFRYLHQAGYEIAWFGKNDVLAPPCFAEIDTYGSATGSNDAGNPYDPADDAYYSFMYAPFQGDPHQTRDMQNVQRGIDFLRQRDSDRPFVLYLPLSLPHPPYGPPEPWASMIDPDDLPPLRPADLPNKPDYMRLIRQYRRLERLDEAYMRRVRATYLGMCAYVDWMLGHLLEALDETGHADDTGLIVTADHGDWAGDYGLVEKWPNALDDCITRVPLLIRLPGGAAGHVVREPVAWFDLMPTMLELSGTEAQHTHFARSLVPQLHGAAGDPDRAVYCDGGYDTHEPHCFEGTSHLPYDIGHDPMAMYNPKGLQQQEHPESVCRATMIRTLTHKLVRRPNGISELYDLVADPRELHNRYGDPILGHQQAALESQLVDWYIHTSDVVPWQRDPRGLPQT